LMKSNLYSRKWKKFLKQVRVFRFVPFTEFVLASGSLATGKLEEGSDFDVVIGVKPGRIFTNRFFAVLILALAGYFKRHMHQKGVSHADLICPNHFVTPKAYKLSPPYNPYWRELYRKMVPVMGDERRIEEFFKANNWLKPPRRYRRDERHLGRGDSWVKSGLEFLLGGWFGSQLERLKFVQIASIKRGLPSNLKKGGRIIYTDDELEFHPDSEGVFRRWQGRK
jgi:hypothetical protein